MIEVRNVSKRFGDFAALDDVSVAVPGGSLTALLGPSGSGKSTLLRVIAGLEQPDAGEVLISGEDASALTPQKREVGFVFQHYAAFKHMTVFENVAFGLRIRKRPKAEVRRRVEELIAFVQLTGFADRYPAQLSGGQRQRMALARALVVEPKVLLLDEPFGALDARVRKDLRAWLRRLHDDVHVTTIFVTHDQEEAMDIADGIVLVNRGRVEQHGAPRELYEHPANEFVMSFVGPVNALDGAYVRPHDLELHLEPNGTTREAVVERVLHLGFEVRVELVLGDGTPASAQVTREDALALDLRKGADRVRPAEPLDDLRRGCRASGSAVSAATSSGFAEAARSARVVRSSAPRRLAPPPRRARSRRAARSPPSPRRASWPVLTLRQPARESRGVPPLRDER